MLEKECREYRIQLFTKTVIQEVTRTVEFVAKTAEQNFGLPRWSWPREDCQFPRWGPPHSATIWHDNSA